jgi:7-cyano-7-deazaguanine synthase
VTGPEAQRARHLVLVSGGLDSTVCMALAASEGGTPPLAVSFDYGQRHRVELDRAQAVAQHYGAQRLVVRLDASAWGGSALTDQRIDVPDAQAETQASTGDQGQSIPVTYVPARNIIFLAVALGVAEARGIDAIHIGVNALDYSGYPDCRPEFIEAMTRVAAVGQKRGVEGDPVAIQAPLIDMSKADIVRKGLELGAPLALTWSCYRGGSLPCGTCDSCRLRAAGFAAAGALDPALGDGAAFSLP